MDHTAALQFYGLGYIIAPTNTADENQIKNFVWSSKVSMQESVDHRCFSRQQFPTSNSMDFSRAPAEAARSQTQGLRVSRFATSHSVPVNSTADDCTKLYCLVTEANVCVQLARGHTQQWSGWEWTRDLQPQVWCHNHYATEPCKIKAAKPT